MRMIVARMVMAILLVAFIVAICYALGRMTNVQAKANRFILWLESYDAPEIIAPTPVAPQVIWTVIPRKDNKGVFKKGYMKKEPTC